MYGCKFTVTEPPLAQSSSTAHLVFFLAQVEKAGSAVEETLFRAFQAICEYSEQHDPSSKRPTLIFDPVNSAVWIKLVKGSQVMRALLDPNPF